MSSMFDELRIAIGIPTAGRRHQVKLTLGQIALQEVMPARLIICPASEGDLECPVATDYDYQIEVVSGPRGLCAQRNAILRASSDVDVMIFMDDDFYPAPGYIAEVSRIFKAHPEIVIATNLPIADGATGPGIPHDTALKVLRAAAESTGAGVTISDTYGGYGCNMAVRMSTVRTHQVFFDEKLPLYGWLEDIEFSRRLAPYGRIVNVSSLQGVHLASKSGRTAGIRLGYSQIANPIYMIRKGSLRAGYAVPQLMRNLAKNTARYLRPEPWVDRRGRLKGNVKAIVDLCRGRLDPANILDL